MSNALSTRTPQIIAVEINSIKDQTHKMLLYNSIEIGRKLVEAKAMLAHGEWGSWLQQSVDYSQSTANNLMNIFEEYGSNQLTLFGDNSNSQAIANLPYRHAVALLAIPSEEREQFIEETDASKLTSRQLQQAIKEKKDLEKQLKQAEENAVKEREARELLAKTIADHEKKSKEHDEETKRLSEELAKAQAAGDSKSTAKLQNELKKWKDDLIASQTRVKTLEEELKKKPIDVPATVEVVPPAVEAELADLRKKLAQSNNKPVIKFRLCFETLNNNFKDLLVALNEIQTAGDPDYPNYKAAVGAAISKITEQLK